MRLGQRSASKDLGEKRDVTLRPSFAQEGVRLGVERRALSELVPTCESGEKSTFASRWWRGGQTVRGSAHPGRAEPARSQIRSLIEAYSTYRMSCTCFECTAPWFFSNLCRHRHKSVSNVSLGPGPSPRPRPPPVRFLSLYECRFWAFHRNGGIRYVGLLCLASVSIMCLRFIWDIACVGTLSLFIAKEYEIRLHFVGLFTSGRTFELFPFSACYEQCC